MLDFTEPTDLNIAIDTLVDALNNATPGTEDYSKLVDQLVKLYKLKEIEVKLALLESETDSKNEANAAEATLKDLEAEALRNERRFLGLKTETLALIAANLIGIGLIIGHERLNVVTSKAVGFVSKLK